MKINNGFKKLIIVSGIVLGAAFVGLVIVAKKKKASSVYEDDLSQKNPMEGKKVVFVEDENDKENADGVKGHLEAVGEINHVPGLYEKYIKRGIDVILSFGGLVALSPIMGAIALAIKIEDPGPILFTQKRLGQNKKYFKLHKFRSMKMNTPHDIPTHMLDNPDQYITKVGKFIRAHSLDELPQLWDIFVGNMSVIGPRPGLWNQDLLTAERDKYGANDVKPGLTGWAQINGRDELEIPDKAKLDGEYVSKMGAMMDVKCFLGSVGVFAKDDSVVEGGTGEMKKKAEPTVCRHYTDEKTDDELIGHIGFGEPVEVDISATKKILIMGAGSYIGGSFMDYAAKNYPSLIIEVADTMDGSWREKNFSKYDIIYHLAGIAHADVGNVDDTIKEKYYSVNTDLAIEVCKKAKEEGVKEFIFMSSMIVYGDSAPYGKSKIVDEHTVPKATNFYGDSKLQADVAVRELADDAFKVLVLRPPMIYGKNSKGNYPTLAKLAKKLPIFPAVENQRSMLHIDNLCEFLCQLMLVKEINRDSVVLIPQNAEWTNTSQMVKEIGEVTGKRVRLVGGIMKSAVLIGCKVPGKIGGLVNKAFGNSCYKKELSYFEGMEYQVVGLNESIMKTEKSKTFNVWENDGELEKYSVLMSVYSKEKPDDFVASIESMLNQTVKCDEFVIVEDGSLTDELEKIVKEYEEKYPNIFHVVRLNQNVGLGKALDKGLVECRNDLIARMDADDISKPERCEKLLQLFKDNKHLSLAGTNIDEFYDDPENIVSSRVVPSDYESICKFMRRRSPFNHPTVMFRKCEVLRVGGYGNMRRKQDLDLFARMLNQNCYALNIDESLLLFRSNANNYQRRKSWEYCKSYIEVEKENYKRGYCSFIDLAVVTLGQTVMYVSPMWLMKLLSDKLLRKKR